MFNFGKKISEEEQRDRLIQKAEKRIEELMPGKTLDEVSEIYRQFYNELEELKAGPDNMLDDIIACLDKYEEVLAIADIFPELGKDSWADYRSGLECLTNME